jgi:hypothetical protein
MVEKRLDAAERAGMSSEILYTIDSHHRIWSKDRLVQRGRITEDMYHASDDVPGDGRAVVAGGIAGAGKTTVLESFGGIDRSQYLTVNPDEVKEKMAERRMIPDVDGLSPMERSGLVHEESSQAASDLATRAYAAVANLETRRTRTPPYSSSSRIVSALTLSRSNVSPSSRPADKAVPAISMTSWRTDSASFET